MAYKVDIIADSIASNGQRLTTFELTYPRIIHSEFMTHRMFSRNAASSRAIPIKKTIQSILDDPFIPVHWGKNQKGMVAQEELNSEEQENAKYVWLRARDDAVKKAFRLIEIGVHKQIVNRLLEPWSWITVVCTATSYSNFFYLRCAPDAQPEIQKLASMMQDCYRFNRYNRYNKLKFMGENLWHLPYVNNGEQYNMAFHYDKDWLEVARKVSVARCARVSLLNQGEVRTWQKDIELHDQLLKDFHFSPFEHQACAQGLKPTQSGNFFGWNQYRKMLAGESH